LILPTVFASEEVQEEIQEEIIESAAESEARETFLRAIKVHLFR